MKTITIEQMENVQGGISFGCGLALAALGLSFAGLIVAGAASAGVGWAAAAFLLDSSVGIIAGCA